MYHKKSTKCMYGYISILNLIRLFSHCTRRRHRSRSRSRSRGRDRRRWSAGAAVKRRRNWLPYAVSGRGPVGECLLKFLVICFIFTNLAEIVLFDDFCWFQPQDKAVHFSSLKGMLGRKNAAKSSREHTRQAVSNQLPWLAMTEKAGPLKKIKKVVWRFLGGCSTSGMFPSNATKRLRFWVGESLESWKLPLFVEGGASQIRIFLNVLPFFAKW